MPSMWRSPYGERPLGFGEWRGKQVSVPTAYERVYASPRAKAAPPPAPRPLVDVFVDWWLHPSVSASISQYIADLETTGYTANLYTGTWADSPALRAQLQTDMAAGLVGAVFVGNLPVAWYEMTEPGGWGGAYVQFPVDLYYADVDGAWVDADENGMYDDHTGAVEPDIWIGRISATTLTWDDEAYLVNNYFAKNHAYRTNALSYQDRALVYIDDDWIPWSTLWTYDVGMAYVTSTLVNDADTTWDTDYEERLTHDYEWISVFAHSWSGGHSFRNTAGESGYTYNSEVRAIDPTALFYNLYACSAARFIEDNYIGGWYIFVDTNGLAAVGSTKTGGMLNFDDFYQPLGQGRCIGSSFLDWQALNNESGAGADSRAWFYGMTILGDPTIMPRHHFFVSVGTPSPSIVASQGSAELSAEWNDSLGHGIASWSWHDGDAGGSFAPSGTVQNPTYTAPVNTTGSDMIVTLTLEASCDGPEPSSDSDSTALTVQTATHSVSVSAGAPDPATVASGASTSLSATADDSLGHGIASWAWDDGGAGGGFSPSATVQSPTYTAPANTTGSGIIIALTVEVTCDGPQPLSDSDSTTLVVQSLAHTLSVSAAAPDPATVVSGGSASLSATATDSLGHGIAAWNWDDGGAGGSFSPSATVRTPEYSAPANVSDGDVTITLTVSAACDGPGSVEESDSTTLTVLPIEHALQITASCSPETITSGGTTDCTATFSDSRGHEAAAWSWSDNGAGGSFSPSAEVQSPTYTAFDNGSDASAIVTLSVTATCDGPAPLSASGVVDVTVLPAVVFPDVEPDHWAYEEIMACVIAGVVAGYEDGFYHGDWAVDRGQMAVYIARVLAGGDDDVPEFTGTPTFPDVQEGFWALDHVEYMAESAVVAGFEDGLYHPEYEVTRDQMAVYVARAQGWVGIDDDMTAAPELFPDVPAGFWSGTAIEACVANGVVQGYEDGYYQPSWAVTRDQMAVYVARAFQMLR